MKIKFTKEAKIGLVTAVALFLLYFGLNFLKGIDIFQPTNRYYIKFQNVNELQQSSPVYVEGFKVGLVQNISYDYQSNDSILVEISLDKSMRIETGTYAKLTSSFTTGASIHLQLNKHVSTYYSPGATLEGRTEPGLMDAVSDKLLPQVEVLLPKLDTILYSLQQVVSHPALMQSLTHIEATTRHLAQSSAQLDKMMNQDMPQIVSNFSTLSSQLQVLGGNLAQVDVAGALAGVEATMKNIDQVTFQMTQPTNSLGLLLNDRQLYDNLSSTAFNASSLLLDFKENPKRYVHFSIWGKK